jgi:apolipoprotein N-acyltransferase
VSRVASFVARRGGWVAAAAGLALPLAFAPFDLYPLAVLCTATLFLSWEGVTPRVAARRGFLFGAGAFLTGTYWIYISVRFFGEAPLFVALPLMLGLVAVMGLYFALLGFAATRWLRAPGLLRWLLAWPAAWVLVEWLRGWVLSGFPWLSLGYSQIDGPLAGLAPVLGVYGVSWAVAISAGAVTAMICDGRRRRGAAVLVLAAVWAGSAALDTVRWTLPAGEPLRASLLQGAVEQQVKWNPEQLAPTLALYRRLTRAHWDSDLIVWPEAAIPTLAQRVDGYLRALHEEARRHGTSIVLGIPLYDPDADQYHNAVLVMDQTLQVYAKRHLVPFGEYFPVPDAVRSWMRLHNLPYTDFAPGDADPAPYRVAGEKIALSICYEDAYGTEQLGYLPAATLIVNVSNDAWFGDSIAPHQHLQIARMRAREAGRFQLRATNTGVSAIIAPDGTLVQTSPQFAPHVLTADVQPHTGSTPYMTLGNRAVIIAVLMALAAGKMGTFLIFRSTWKRRAVGRKPSEK